MLDGHSIVSKWKDNYLCRDWVYGFKKRNHLSSRMAGNITRARAAVNETTVKAFFKEFKEFCRVNDIPPENVMNYDEANLTDDPGKKNLFSSEEADEEWKMSQILPRLQSQLCGVGLHLGKSCHAA